MSLKDKIKQALTSANRKLSMSEIYELFPDIKRTTIRGRVYENLGKGIERIDNNLYISSSAIIEMGNSLTIIDRMIEQGDIFDAIFLDIPYHAGGIRGGNRNLFELDKITVAQFSEFAPKVRQLLNGPDAKLIFMFTSGKSSVKQHDAYLQCVTDTGLQLCDLGSYQKLWKNGRVMNFGKHTMPREHIYVFSENGIATEADLHFQMSPNLHEYPTSKPLEMIKSIVRQLTMIGDWVFDPFGGSGKTLQACLELERNCHIIDNNPTSMEMMLRLV